MNNRSFKKAINLVFTLALVFGLLLPGSTTLAADSTPNDTRYLTSEQWNLNGTNGINAPAAWTITNGSGGVVVAVIDTGITDHEDLEGARILPGYDFISLETSALDGADPGGIERDADPSDRGDWCEPPPPYSSWQGTHIAGIIGAWSNNNKGIAGINWDANILPVRVRGYCGSVSVTDLMDGMKWAAGLTSGLPANLNPAKVLNVGVGVPGQACTAAYQTVIDDIINNKHAVIVAAAGDNNSTTLDFPANCAGVISVAATDVNGNRASTSNYGSAVEISAPGENVLSTNNSGEDTPNSVINYYTTKTGTGIAAAHVSGVVSLMLSMNSGMTPPSYIVQVLQATAKAFPGGSTCDTLTCGSGIVDAGAALIPDLVITNAFLKGLVSGDCPDGASPPAPAYSPPPSTDFCMYITVKNQGSKDSGSLVSRNIYVDRDPSTLGVEIDPANSIYGRLYTPPDPDNDDPGDYHKDNQLAGIAAGGVFTQGVKITGLSSAGHVLYGYVDAFGIVPEVFENNNNFLPPITTSGSISTIVHVEIGGAPQGDYPMVSGESAVKKYTLDGGPVKFSSNNGAKIVASLNQWRRPLPSGGWTGVAQSMGLPIEQISDKYVIPRYNGTDPTLYNAVLMANVDTVSRDITVKIGTTQMGTYTLAPSASQFAVYNVVGGPVVVSSAAGSKIVASLYELKRGVPGVGWNGQSEMMGLTWSQVSDKYLIPIYFGNWPSVLDASLVFANVDTMATSVVVKIAGLPRGTYPMAPNTSMVVRYVLDGGPVEISSNNGAKIVASLNQWRRPLPTGGWTGVAQSMALPVELISDKYVMPRYNGTDPTLYNAVLMANVDTVSRDISVKIGTTQMGTYTLAPSASQFAVYNVVGGPIVVSSAAGSKIVASLYELKRGVPGVGWNGQSEMMGVTWSLISDKYLIPIYFGNWGSVLDASLNIGVP